MLYVRYFVLVGAVLLGGLFAVDGYLPKPESSRDRKDIDRSTIRISSAINLQEKVVIDTTLPTIPAPVQEAPTIEPATPLAVSPRDAFAQIAPPSKVRVAATKRKTLARRVAVKKTQEAFFQQPSPNSFENWFR